MSEVKREEIYKVLEQFDDDEIDFEQAMDLIFAKLNKPPQEKEDKVDRVKDWNEFAQYMSHYIEDKTVAKYGKKTGIDLMAMTDPHICTWNVLKYSIRLFNNGGKRYDLEKIIHYSQMAVTLSGGDLTKCGVRESENPNRKFWLED